jgi:uncharacterized protein YciI
MLFALIAIDKENALELRLKTREAHFAWARETNLIVLGGPFLDDGGNMAGSLVIFEAENLEAAKRLVAQDPYQKAGLFQKSEVRPWKLTYNPRDFTV